MEAINAGEDHRIDNIRKYYERNNSKTKKDIQSHEVPELQVVSPAAPLK